MAKQSITVNQFHNPKFDMEKPVDDADSRYDNFRYVYRITKANNILSMKAPVMSDGPVTTKVISCGVGEMLTPRDVQALIDKKVDVTILQIK